MPKPLRVLMLNYDCPPLGAGAGQMAFGLSKALVRAGHQVDFVTMGFKGLPAREEIEGVRIHRVPCLRRRAHMCTMAEAATYVVSALVAVRRLVRQHRYDLIHAHFIFPGGPIGWCASRWTKVPYLITAHGSDVPGYNPYRLQLVHWMMAPLWRAIVRRARHVVCPSRRLRSLLAACGASAPVTIIPNGMDAPPATAPQPRLRRILIVGRMVQLKGVQHALAALNGFSKDYELHIVGDGPYLPTLRQMAEAQGARVTFWGWVDSHSPKFRELFETSSLFILPSESENFPVVLLEAMAAGLPIITTSGTGCDEVVGDAALLVPPGDVQALRYAVKRLIEDEPLRRTLGQAARRRLEEQFSWSAVAARYAALYQRAEGA
ncbi:MAG: glycosyltransferase family 4 protein [Candidatus Omnitrophica bacterium]|nr:glycosyltransferase family 4 protein [Candidatus Omnitrophota bacterium]